MKINYLEEDFPVSYQYDDYDEHTVRLSKNIDKIGVKINIGGYDDQIIYYNSGIMINELLPSCFINCKSLKDIVLGDNVKIINDEAFKNCEELSGITIDSVYGIGNEAFLKSGIRKLTLDLRSSLSGYTYEGCDENNISVGPFIGDYAFASCENLTDVELITSTELGEHMFDGCSNLTSIIFSNHGQCVGSYAFANCTNLKNIKFPKNFEGISENMFDGCTSLSDVSIDQNSPKFYTISDNAFKGCNNLTSLILPKSINNFNYIDDNAFKDSNLKYIKFKGINSNIFNKYLHVINITKDENTILKSLKQLKEYDGSIQYATWYGFNFQLIEDATQQRIPIISIRCTPECAGCRVLKSTINENEFQTWMSTAPYIFMYTDQTSVTRSNNDLPPNILTAEEYKKMRNWFNNTQVPFYKLLWTKDDNSVVSESNLISEVRKPQELIDLFSKNFKNYQFQQKYFTQEVTETTITFECFGLKDGCILESADGIKYKWDIELKQLVLV